MDESVLTAMVSNSVKPFNVRPFVPSETRSVSIVLPESESAESSTVD